MTHVKIYETDYVTWGKAAETAYPAEILSGSIKLFSYDYMIHRPIHVAKKGILVNSDFSPKSPLGKSSRVTEEDY